MIFIIAECACALPQTSVCTHVRRLQEMSACTAIIISTSQAHWHALTSPPQKEGISRVRTLLTPPADNVSKESASEDSNNSQTGSNSEPSDQESGTEDEPDGPEVRRSGYSRNASRTRPCGCAELLLKDLTKSRFAHRSRRCSARTMASCTFQAASGRAPPAANSSSYRKRPRTTTIAGVAAAAARYACGIAV